jgi:TolB-like protein/DNA-binding winged helix-turn-helix (wHTH) protein/Tfp pilus assembly protein PilF
MRVKTFRFGPFEIDPQTGELRKGRIKVRLQGQTAEVLLMLLQRPGELITREEFRQKLWPEGTFVDFEHGLNVAINRLRARLRDTADNPRFIETLTGRGYRFIAPVTSLEQEGPAGGVSPMPSLQHGGTLPWKRKRFLAVALGLLTLAVAGIYASRKWNHPRPGRSRTMLAVLPVQNLTGETDHDYISDGLTEEMIAQLGSLNPRQLGVIGRTSSMVLKQTTKTIDQIGRELGVDYILESSIRGSGDHLRVTAQLIRTTDQTHVWVGNYDRAVRDIVAVQDEISHAVADKIRLTLAAPQGGRLVTVGGMKAEAYQDYLRGRFLWNQRTQEGFLKARSYFEQAIEKDPGHPLGYAGLADAYLGLSDYDVLPAKEAIPRSKAAARKAIEMDDSVAEAHATLASSLCEFDWDVPAAESEFRRAIAINPSYATAHQWYAECMLWVGRISESEPEFKRAKELDPLSPIITRNEGLPLFIGRRYNAYLDFCHRALLVDSTFWGNHFALAWTYELKKDLPRAIAEFETAHRLFESSLTLAHLAHVYAGAGRRRDAEDVLARLKAISKQRYVPAVHIAMVFEGLGDKEEAFRWLDKAYDERYWWMIMLKTDPRWDSLRSDPRFHNLLRRVGLSQ